MLEGDSTVAGIAADIVVGAGCELHVPACDSSASPQSASDFAKFIEEPVYSFEHRALFVRA
jgi:hypothetical protein